jgi:hypothetical protein
MTRINVVPVEELTREHLIAEYRELPRVYELVRKRIAKGHKPTLKTPPRYTLGTGHVLFFYNKLGWINERYISLCNEMRRRKYTVNYGDVDQLCKGIPPDWFGTFIVDDEALKINRDRIKERLED